MSHLAMELINTKLNSATEWDTTVALADSELLRNSTQNQDIHLLLFSIVLQSNIVMSTVIS